MAKMDDESLLAHLQALEEDSSAFTWGRLAGAREKSMKEYFRAPYGNEEDGLSCIVTSEVQDTIEWILPDLLDIFTSTDKAVCFEPSREEDVKGAEQATDACNYVFYKQNNGFLNLYTAFKDALQVKNCAVMWRKETKRTKTVVPVKAAPIEIITMILEESGKDAEIESQQPIERQPIIDPFTMQDIGPPQLYNARISKIEKKTTIKVEAFPPEELNVQRDWTTPLLADCPYVERSMRVSLSDIHEMGHTEITVEDLAGSDDPRISADSSYRENRSGTAGEAYNDNPTLATEDDSRTMGYLRLEYVLVDFDGDGIAERRCIYRLKEKILSNEECSHVPIATASPILIQHRWDGMSISEAVSDLQELNTELTRQMVDSGRLALNPRTKVLTGPNWSPLANIDDLLDSRAGGIVRISQADAVQEMITPWVGAQMFPMLEYTNGMLEKRTGVSRQNQGLDPDSLNRTKGGTSMIMNAAHKRIKLIARVFAEVLIKPIFQGVLKLLTDGEMEKIAFRLRNEFVEMDPNEWRDSYDMTTNVGLGTGDKEHQMMVLQSIAMNQAHLSASPFGPLLITPKNIFNTQSKMVEHAGFKNVGDFFQDPKEQQVPPPQPPPDPSIQIKQMELAADAQKFHAESQREGQKIQFEAQAKLREQQAALQLQAANDERDAQRELMQAQYQAQLDELNLQLTRYKTDEDNRVKLIMDEADNRTKIIVANIAHPEGEYDTKTGEKAKDPIAPVMDSLKKLHDHVTTSKILVRDASGQVTHVQHGDKKTPVKRDENGRVIGI